MLDRLLIAVTVTIYLLYASIQALATTLYVAEALLVLCTDQGASLCTRVLRPVDHFPLFSIDVVYPRLSSVHAIVYAL